MLRSYPIGAHLIRKDDVWKKYKLSILNVWMFWTCKRTFDLHQIMSIVSMRIPIDSAKISSGYESHQMSFGVMEETWIHLFNCWLFNLINLGDCFGFQIETKILFPFVGILNLITYNILRFLLKKCTKSCEIEGKNSEIVILR